jgi:hypothetical protein
MRENIARNMQRSQGKINCPTQLRLVGHYRKLYHDARKRECQVNDVSLFCLSLKLEAVITPVRMVGNCLPVDTFVLDKLVVAQLEKKSPY